MFVEHLWNVKLKNLNMSLDVCNTSKRAWMELFKNSVNPCRCFKYFWDVKIKHCNISLDVYKQSKRAWMELSNNSVNPCCCLCFWHVKIKHRNISLDVCKTCTLTSKAATSSYEFPKQLYSLLKSTRTCLKPSKTYQNEANTPKTF